MKLAIPLAFLASPALAHPGTHLHPQDAGFGLVAAGLLLVALAALTALRSRR